MGLFSLFENIGNYSSIQAFHITSSNNRNGSVLKPLKSNDRAGVETFIETHDRGKIVYTDKKGFRQNYEWGK